MSRPQIALHAVTSPEILARPDFLDHAVAVARVEGVGLHLRDRTRSGTALIELAERIASAAPGAVVLCNDRADVAAACAAVAGVHLPEAGLPVAATRAWLGPGKLIGRSTHAPTAAVDALEDGADYAFLGPVYATTSHPDRAPLGLDPWGDLRGRAVVAIGGVTPARVRACRQAGVHGVAAITAIWDATSPGSAAEAMRVLLG